MPLKQAYLAKKAQSGKKKLTYTPAPDDRQYSDNTRVVNSYVPTASFVKKKVAPTSTPKKTLPKAAVVTKPTTTSEPIKPFVSNSKYKYTPSKEETSYSDNTNVYNAADPLNRVAKPVLAERQARVDYEQSKSLNQDGSILPTPAVAFAKSFVGMNNQTKDFTESQKRATAYAIAKAEKRKSGAGTEGYTGSFDYGDYPGGYRDKEGNAHNVPFTNLRNLSKFEMDGKNLKRIKSVGENWGSVAAQTTLGKANFRKHNDKDYLVHDVYNFDSHDSKNPSMLDRLEGLAFTSGTSAETNLAVPVKYVEEARKQIASEEKQSKAKVSTPVEKTPKATQPTQPAKTVAKQPTIKQTSTPVKAEVPPIATKPLAVVAPRITPVKKSLDTDTTATTTPTTKLSPEETKVAKYQTMLNKRYNAGIATDGAWGPETQAAYEKHVLKK
jgi:hypothetical protein